MRAQAMEKLLERFEEAVEEAFWETDGDKSKFSTLVNLSVKSQILRSRERDESVIRELINP